MVQVNNFSEYMFTISEFGYQLVGYSIMVVGYSFMIVVRGCPRPCHHLI